MLALNFVFFFIFNYFVLLASCQAMSSKNSKAENVGETDSKCKMYRYSMSAYPTKQQCFFKKKITPRTASMVSWYTVTKTAGSTQKSTTQKLENSFLSRRVYRRRNHNFFNTNPRRQNKSRRRYYVLNSVVCIVWEHQNRGAVKHGAFGTNTETVWTSCFHPAITPQSKYENIFLLSLLYTYASRIATKQYANLVSESVTLTLILKF